MTAHLNVEIKARCASPKSMLERLAGLGAIAQGLDHQIDTYFEVPLGRLKLRTGSIENALIHYQRSDQPGPKDSTVTLYETHDGPRLTDVLTAGLNVLVVVDKHRHILWIDNVKFHVDDVVGLGSFVEIEAIDRTGELGRERLLEQCEELMRELEIADSDLESGSYSDLLRGVDDRRRTSI